MNLDLLQVQNQRRLNSRIMGIGRSFSNLRTLQLSSSMVSVVINRKSMRNVMIQYNLLLNIIKYYYILIMISGYCCIIILLFLLLDLCFWNSKSYFDWTWF